MQCILHIYIHTEHTTFDNLTKSVFKQSLLFGYNATAARLLAKPHLQTENNYKHIVYSTDILILGWLFYSLQRILTNRRRRQSQILRFNSPSLLSL